MPCCETTRVCFTTMQHTHHELDTLVEDAGCVRDVGLLLLAHLAPSCHILLDEVSLLLARSWVLSSVPGASTAEVWTCCGCGKISRHGWEAWEKNPQEAEIVAAGQQGEPVNNESVTHQPTSSQPWLLHHPQCRSYAAAVQLACTPVHALQPKRKGWVRRSTMHDHNDLGLLHERTTNFPGLHPSPQGPTVFIGDHSRHVSEVGALLPGNSTHPAIVVSVAQQGPVVPEGGAGRHSCSLCHQVQALLW